MSTHVAGTSLDLRRSHVAGTRTQVVGLTLLALAPLTMFASGMATGTPLAEGVPFLVIGVVIGAGAWAAGRFGTSARVAGIVLTVLAVFAGFWMAFGLMAVGSPADFVPGVLFVLGAVLSLAGGVQSIRGRRHAPVVAPTVGEGRARLLAVVVVLLAAVVSVTVNLTGRQSVDAAAAADAAPVTMDAMAFASPEVVVTGGAGAGLLVSNRDAFLHDLAIPAEDLAVTVTPGSEALLDMSGLAAGTYTFYCTLHSDTADPDPSSAGMAGTLVVR